MTEIRVAERLAAVRERIAKACQAAGRDPAEVTLVAVTKRIPLARVVAACRAGQWDFGENRIQEALARQPELAHQLSESELPSERVRWHFIGHLQRNKAGKAVGQFGLLHAVDSRRLADRLQERAQAVGVKQPVLIEVNLSQEPQKFGIIPAEAIPLAVRVAAQNQLELMGFMTMARFGAPETELRQTFAALRQIATVARQETGLALPHLSMGMSDDFELAIAEGATLVRVGTAIFGPRSAP
jgi:pyridoxal phosphate enzyme (YggS family)